MKRDVAFLCTPGQISDVFSLSQLLLKVEYKLGFQVHDPMAMALPQANISLQGEVPRTLSGKLPTLSSSGMNNGHLAPNAILVICEHLIKLTQIHLKSVPFNALIVEAMRHEDYNSVSYGVLYNVLIYDVSNVLHNHDLRRPLMQCCLIPVAEDGSHSPVTPVLCSQCSVSNSPAPADSTLTSQY